MASWLAVLVLSASSAPAWPQPPERPPAQRRPAGRLLACSPDGWICVHGEPTPLRAADVAWLARSAARVRAAYDALGLPRPPDDGWLGDTFGYDLYVDPDAKTASTHADGLDPVARFDSASAFSVVPPPVSHGGCGPELDLARALAEAVLLGLDPALCPGGRTMLASYLATLVAPCTAVEAVAVDAFQRSPERSLVASAPGELSGALLFPCYLDYTWGLGQPGAVLTALVSVGPQRSPADAFRLTDEPDLFDALRHATRARRTSLGDVLLDFAVARAFAGSRSDGVHLPDTERYGDFGRVRFEWALSSSSLPRRLGPLTAIEPTGATYLWLDLADWPQGSTLQFAAQWPAGHVFRWALVKLDAAGQEVGRLGPPGIWGADSAQLTVADLDHLAGLLVVGTHLGSDDRSAPYDPDRNEDAALYSVTLARENR